MKLPLASLLAPLLVGFVLAATPSPTPKAPAPETLVSGDAIEDVEAFFIDCEAFGWSGTVHIQRGKKVLLSRGFGLADDESGRECEPDSLFEIASITKPIVAAGVLALVEARKVDLDASIAEYLPDVPDHAKGITVRHLLLHSSGMSPSGPTGQGADLEAAVAAYLSQPPVSDPGDAFEYWNGGYALLAGIIEQRSGKSFEDYLRSRIFKKAGMKSTGFTGDDLPLKEQARGYQTGEADRWASEHPYGSYGWQYKGMGGVVTHAEDLAKFMQALARGKMIDRDLVTVALTPDTRRRGLGWEINWDFPSRSNRLEHGGSVRGFRSFAQHVLGSQLSIVVLSNRADCPTTTMAVNARLLTQGEPGLKDQPRLPPPTVEWKKSQLGELVGDWTSEHGATLKLTASSPRTLNATSSIALWSSVGERGGVGSPTVFGTVSEFGLATHAWATKPTRNSELVWNGLKGKQAHLTLTDPNGKAIAFSRE